MMEELPSDIPIPDTMPVMALDGATQFPRVPMPLFIFEQRFRDMLSYVLEGDRMFGVACVAEQGDLDSSPNPVCPTFTAGLIRACVTHDDGTSHLMLFGLQRVEIIGWAQVFPFRIANIVPVDNIVIDEVEEQELAYQVIGLCQKVLEANPMTNVSEQMRDLLAMLSDPIVVADLVGHHFVNNPTKRQDLLEIILVKDRLVYLIEYLKAMI